MLPIIHYFEYRSKQRHTTHHCSPNFSYRNQKPIALREARSTKFSLHKEPQQRQQQQQQRRPNMSRIIPGPWLGALENPNLRVEGPMTEHDLFSSLQVHQSQQPLRFEASILG